MKDKIEISRALTLWLGHWCESWEISLQFLAWLPQASELVFISVSHPQHPSLLTLWIFSIFRLRSGYFLLFNICILRSYVCLLSVILIYLK